MQRNSEHLSMVDTQNRIKRIKYFLLEKHSKGTNAYIAASLVSVQDKPKIIVTMNRLYGKLGRQIVRWLVERIYKKYTGCMDQDRRAIIIIALGMTSKIWIMINLLADYRRK